VILLVSLLVPAGQFGILAQAVRGSALAFHIHLRFGRLISNEQSHCGMVSPSAVFQNVLNGDMGVTEHPPTMTVFAWDSLDPVGVKP
jgi:hypothetical protein